MRIDAAVSGHFRADMNYGASVGDEAKDQKGNKGRAPSDLETETRRARTAIAGVLHSDQMICAFGIQDSTSGSGRRSFLLARRMTDSCVTSIRRDGADDAVFDSQPLLPTPQPTVLKSSTKLTNPVFPGDSFTIYQWH